MKTEKTDRFSSPDNSRGTFEPYHFVFTSLHWLMVVTGATQASCSLANRRCRYGATGLRKYLSVQSSSFALPRWQNCLRFHKLRGIQPSSAAPLSRHKALLATRYRTVVGKSWAPKASCGRCFASRGWINNFSEGRHWVVPPNCLFQLKHGNILTVLLSGREVYNCIMRVQGMSSAIISVKFHGFELQTEK